MNFNIKHIIQSTIFHFIFSYYPCSSIVLSFNYWKLRVNFNTHLLFYQQSDDVTKPYLAQYSAVIEDSPVRVS